MWVLPLGTEGGVDIAGDSVVGCGVGPVGGDVDFETGVGLDFVVVFGEGAYGYVVGEDDDAVVVGADADFVFGAYHAVGWDSAELGGLDGEGVVAVVEGGANGSDDDFLAGGDVCGSANDVEWLIGADVDGGDVEVVGIGMGDAGEYFSDDEALEAAFDALGLLHPIDFESNGREEG